MRKIVFTLIIFLLLCPAKALAEWQIDDFSSNVDILKSGVVQITEQIKVDFGTEKKHGIFRSIPYEYVGQKDSKAYLEIKPILVKRNNIETKYKTYLENGNFNFKIGDNNALIDGAQEYLLTYQVVGALRTFLDYDELYWNITGNGWETTIEHSKAVISNQGILQKKCYQGQVGSTETCKIEGSSFIATKALPPGEGLTLAVSLPKNTYPILSAQKPKSIFDKLFSFEAIAVFLLTLLATTGGIFWLWLTKGRDKWLRLPLMLDHKQKDRNKPLFNHEIVTVEFTPPENLRPAEIGVLMDQKADTTDVTATIIDLAARGFLTIKEIPKKWLFGNTDYALTKTKSTSTNLAQYESELLKKLFTNQTKNVLVSELKNTFYEDLKSIKTLLYTEMTTKGLFVANPEQVRSSYLGYAILLLTAGVCLLFFSLNIEAVLLIALAAGLTTGSILLLITSQYMPRRTAKGYDLYRRSKGYRQFIAKSETYRQRFFEKKNMFNEIMPYAVMFGLTEKFAKAMKEMSIEPQKPSWYQSNTAYSPLNFSKQINTLSSSMSSAIASSPSGSGTSGGSSGGGFGGGGGGSW